MQFLIDLPPDAKLLLVFIFTFILGRIIKIQDVWIMRVREDIEVTIFEDVPFRQRIFFYFPALTAMVASSTAASFGQYIFILPQDLIAVVVLGLGIIYNLYIGIVGGDPK